MIDLSVFDFLTEMDGGQIGVIFKRAAIDAFDGRWVADNL
jgi:hypothetical protein